MKISRGRTHFVNQYTKPDLKVKIYVSFATVVSTDEMKGTCTRTFFEDSGEVARKSSRTVGRFHPSWPKYPASGYTAIPFVLPAQGGGRRIAVTGEGITHLMRDDPAQHVDLQ